MFVDASALTAILCDEHDGHELLARLQKAQERLTSPLAIWESVIAVARNLGLEVRDAHDAVEQFLRLADIVVVAVSPEARAIAIEAYDRFGKSRHPANLNFGDCLAYACARQARVALLYKGDDFPHTDIETA
ncbi:PIN domain-containing protein [Sphingomonas histidinilytica]|uniref:type II toxin-antitoxin system VapC family toxin n=1 Tax=Rhizorhabdus histidinilytica TaxID=439228 RepID=UPI001ADB296C|nr:type II toxin-antitoxin system VapC family toxin [Rhizorhabdus histidinilytica]MBO9375564.1 PIN domain-containing protein [Rhizorhabdus histidinilytica]